MTAGHSAEKGEKTVTSSGVDVSMKVLSPLLPVLQLPLILIDAFIAMISEDLWLMHRCCIRRVF